MGGVWRGRGGEALVSITRGLNSSSTWLVEASLNTTRRDTRKLPQGWRYFHERQCCQHSRQRIKKRRCGQQAGSFVTRCSVSRGAQRKAHVERYVDETLVDLQWASRPLVATSRRAAKEAPTRRGPFVRSFARAVPRRATTRGLRAATPKWAAAARHTPGQGSSNRPTPARVGDDETRARQ